MIFFENNQTLLLPRLLLQRTMIEIFKICCNSYIYVTRFSFSSSLILIQTLSPLKCDFTLFKQYSIVEYSTAQHSIVD